MDDLIGKSLIKYMCLSLFVFSFVYLSNSFSSYVMSEQKSDYREYYIEATSKESLTMEEFNELKRRADIWVNDIELRNKQSELYFSIWAFFMSVYAALLFYLLRFCYQGYSCLSILCLATISAFIACGTVYQGIIWFLISLFVSIFLVQKKLLTVVGYR